MFSWCFCPPCIRCPLEQRSRILQPHENIADYIRQVTSANEHEPTRFTITAQVLEGPLSQSDITRYSTLKKSLPESSTVTMDVIKATPAVTSATQIVMPDGSSRRFGVSSSVLNTLLVSDANAASGHAGLTILAIDQKTDYLHGITKSEQSSVMKIRQVAPKGMVSATEEEVTKMPAWECAIRKADGDTLFHRDLQEPHHSDEGEHHGEHNHDHRDDSSTITVTDSISTFNYNSDNNTLKKRHLQNSNLPYSYQVNIFIEIDNDFIANTGGGTRDAAGITPNAYNYINALVMAANIIFESEIDTHLNVHTIKLSTLYDSATSISEALEIMRNNYGGDAWHTDGVTLHHGLLGKNLGGGKSYIGVLCNPGWAFGVTSSISGDFSDLDSRTVWDMKILLHELGHSFGSDHTHEIDYYSPVIDTCGTSCPATAGYQWATLMSLCNWCLGDFENIMYTYGGIFHDSGNKSDISDWIDNPKLVANYDDTHKSVDPRREGHRMFLHVSSRGSCVIPPVSQDPPIVFATYDTTLKVPKCTAVAKSCASGNLLLGRGNIGPSEGGTSPNSLDSCTDGTNGSYLSDESLERIKISSIDSDLLTVGSPAEIVAVAYVWSSIQNFVDFYYATDPFSPSWHLIASVSPTWTGRQSMRVQFSLGASALQAVRVVIRYGQSYSNSSSFICPTSGYDDVDDLVFAVSTTEPAKISTDGED
eukprot:CCRYP_002210-RA/>CCRYP_002210-RA protein AED:0.19 eAED:0.19 QI:275/1/1/1/1/1/5/100/704